MLQIPAQPKDLAQGHLRWIELSDHFQIKRINVFETMRYHTAHIRVR